VISTKILSRKQSVPSGDCRGGTYIYRFPGRRTTDAGLLTYDSKSSTPGLLEPVDLVTDCSRPVSSMSSSIAVDEITSLPGSPFYRQVPRLLTALYFLGGCIISQVYSQQPPALRPTLKLGSMHKGSQLVLLKYLLSDYVYLLSMKQLNQDHN